MLGAGADLKVIPAEHRFCFSRYHPTAWSCTIRVSMEAIQAGLRLVKGSQPGWPGTPVRDAQFSIAKSKVNLSDS